jgi:hypothetical protein
VVCVQNLIDSENLPLLMPLKRSDLAFEQTTANRVFPIRFDMPYLSQLMSNSSESFRILANQFESLSEQLKECPTPAARTRLLKRMKIVIDAVDALTPSDLKEHTPEITSSLPHGQSTAAPPNSEGLELERS